MPSEGRLTGEDVPLDEGTGSNSAKPPFPMVCRAPKKPHYLFCLIGSRGYGRLHGTQHLSSYVHSPGFEAQRYKHRGQSEAFSPRREPRKDKAAYVSKRPGKPQLPRLLPKHTVLSRHGRVTSKWHFLSRRENQVFRTCPCL